MKTHTTLVTVGVALLGIAGCDSKVESSRKEAVESKADALDVKAGIARKDAKTYAADIAKQAAMDAESAKADAIARAEAEKKAALETAEGIRKSGELKATALEEKAKETRDQK